MCVTDLQTLHVVSSHTTHKDVDFSFECLLDCTEINLNWERNYCPNVKMVSNISRCYMRDFQVIAERESSIICGGDELPGEETSRH